MLQRAVVVAVAAVRRSVEPRRVVWVALLYRGNKSRCHRRRCTKATRSTMSRSEDPIPSQTLSGYVMLKMLCFKDYTTDRQTNDQT